MKHIIPLRDKEPGNWRIGDHEIEKEKKRKEILKGNIHASLL